MQDIAATRVTCGTLIEYRDHPENAAAISIDPP
jgi:hypothetical protein